MNRLLLSAILGGLVLATPTFFVTKAVYQRATLRAERDLADLKTELATARADVRAKTDQLNRMLLEDRDAQLAKIDGVAVGLDRLSQRVSLCANKSDVRVTLTPTGAIAAVPDEQLRNAQRDLATVVGEFARACAVGRDKDAVDHNKLVDFTEQLQKIIQDAQGKEK